MNLAIRQLHRPLQATSYQIARHMASAAAVDVSTSSSSSGPIETILRSKLEAGFSTHSFLHLNIANESYKHNVPKGAESHFNVLVVSDAFEGVNMIGRHRMVNKILAIELAGHIHALSIQAKTVSQWEADPAFIATPNCLGGSKK